MNERTRRSIAVLAGAWDHAPAALSLTPERFPAVANSLFHARCGALAWHRVRSIPQLVAVPEVRLLRDSYYHTLAQSPLKERALSSAVARLQRAGIDPIAAKGWAISRLYPAPGLRPYQDIDLYVAPEQFAAAREMLAPFARGVVSIDLQHTIIELDDRARPALRARAEVTGLGGVEMRVLSAEDHLRLQCLHFLRHACIRPLWLCDISIMLQSLPATFEWDYFLHGSRKRADWLASVIVLAHDLLDARIERTPFADQPWRVPEWLRRSVLQQWEYDLNISTHEPLYAFRTRPVALARAIFLRLRNPLEATIEWGGRPSTLPKFPLQALDAATRGWMLAGRSIGLLQHPTEITSQEVFAEHPGRLRI